MSSPCWRTYCLCSTSLSRMNCLKCPHALQPRNAINQIPGQMESIEIVAHGHVERRRGRAFFLVSADVEIVMIVAPVCEPVNQPGIAVVGENHGSVGRENRIEIRIG